jgi:WH2 motif
MDIGVVCSPLTCLSPPPTRPLTISHHSLSPLSTAARPPPTHLPPHNRHHLQPTHHRTPPPVHQTKPLNADYSQRYKRSRYRPFSAELARHTAWLLLHALLYLRRNGFPPFSSLHCGNVFLHRKPSKSSPHTAQLLLSDYENELLGLQPRLTPLQRAMPDTAPDVVAFGVALFTMCVAPPLAQVQSPRFLWPLSQHGANGALTPPLVAQVLGRIFDTTQAGAAPPTLDELRTLPLFCSDGTTVLEEPVWPRPQISRAVKDLLQLCRREVRRRLSGKRPVTRRIPLDIPQPPPRSRSHRRTPSASVSSTRSITSSPAKQPRLSSSSRQASAMAAPPPPPPPPPLLPAARSTAPVPTGPPASASKARSNLLASIRQSNKAKLRHTATTDKSQPTL